MEEPIEFTDRESFILSYYRDPQLSSWSRHAALEGICLGVSIFFLVLYLVHQDEAWGLVAYGLLAWRVGSHMCRGRGFTEDLRSAIRKYDAKIRELGEQPPGTMVKSEVQK